MKKTVVFNALQTSLSGGIGRYSYELAKSLYNRDDILVKIVIREEDKKKFNFVSEEDLIVIENINNSKQRNIYEQFVLPFKVRKLDKNAILHYPDAMAPILATNKVVITIHDLAYKSLKDVFTWKTSLWKKVITPISIIKAKKVVAITNFAKEEIEKHYNSISKNKVEVVYNGFNKFSSDESNYKRESEKINEIIDSKYMLTVSTISPRKNMDGLIEAFDKIKDEVDHSLVICGNNGWLYEAVFEKVKELNLTDRVKFTGGVTDDELIELYKNCDLFVYPSFYEGFGLPPLEAMSFDKKCVVSNVTSIPEVVGDAGLYFNPNNKLEMAEKILEALNSDVDKEKIKNTLSKFSWDKCAKNIVEDVYSKI